MFGARLSVSKDADNSPIGKTKHQEGWKAGKGEYVADEGLTSLGALGWPI